MRCGPPTVHRSFQNVEVMLNLMPSLEARGILMSGIESIVAPGATTLAVDLLRRLAGPAADQVGFMLGDKAWEYRANNLIKITLRLQRKLREVGLPANAVHPRLLLPIIENCSVEDNETLQEMWAGLLVTASQEKDSMSPSFIETLKQLTPDEARLLQQWWTDKIRPALAKERSEAAEMDSKVRELRRQKGLPDKTESLMTGVRRRVVRQIQQWDFGVHSDTLERLGLIRRDFGVQVKTTRGGGDEITDVESEVGYRLVYTEYAVRFLEACHGAESKI